MRSKPFLELDGITIRVDGRLLFRNTHWTFARNQNWALVGGNGSGKSLLARAIAGEVPVVEGEIRYGFRCTRGMAPEERVLLFSFEQQKALAGEAPEAVRWYSLEQDEACSADEFLSYNRVEEINPFEVNARREQTRRSFNRHRQSIIRLLKIRSLLRHSLPSLSNGEMRKVLLARALLRRPRLLILDDAFSGLDSEYRGHLRRILEDLMQKGIVRILLIDPLLDELPRGITHVLSVDHCRVVAQGSRREIMHQPRAAKQIQGPRASMSRPKRQPRGSGNSGRAREELVKLKDASVQYNGRRILSGVNWTIHRGESWALVGPNGSGKSTLLSLISGDNPQAYANEISIFGRRRGTGESVWDFKKRIGSISPELHLHFPDIQTSLETVISGLHDSLGLYRRPTTDQRAAAARMLDQFGLGPLANDFFHSLSTGSQRMVLLARALVKSPDLLLLDEPCQGLDSRHRSVFLHTLEMLLRRTRVTIIYVTHRSEEIPKGIERILRLEDGRATGFGKIPNRRRKAL